MTPFKDIRISVPELDLEFARGKVEVGCRTLQGGIGHLQGERSDSTVLVALAYNNQL